MNVSIVIPFALDGDAHRHPALGYVLDLYRRDFPDWPIVVGDDPADGWSKGRAIASALGEVDDDPARVLVLADADSFLTDPTELRRAVDSIRERSAAWVMPHATVLRLTEAETARIIPKRLPPRTRKLIRPPYLGTVGGGITVLTRKAYNEVGGIDPDFVGWGGEDVAFGYALETLVHPYQPRNGRLVHLWHPHPAPNLRGSEASEDLVAAYTAARGFPRRMRALIAGEDPEPPTPLDHPVRFRIKDARRSVRLLSGDVIRFDKDGEFETSDPDIAEALRRTGKVRKATP